jgi:hypothetical protein
VCQKVAKEQSATGFLGLCFSLFTWLQPDQESFPGNARLPGKMPSIFSSCDEDSAKTTLIDDDGKPSTTMHLPAGLQVPAAAPDHVKAGLNW